MSKWQPIETAPRDGTWVIVSGFLKPEDRYLDSIGDWSKSDEAPSSVIARFQRETEAWFDDEDQEWVPARQVWRFSSYDSGIYGADIINPTHWMPLPDLQSFA